MYALLRLSWRAVYRQVWQRALLTRGRSIRSILSLLLVCSRGRAHHRLEMGISKKARSRPTQVIRWTMLPLSADIFSTTCPMTVISGVLESSHQALSIRRIIRLIRRLLFNRLGQKGVYILLNSTKSTASAGFSPKQSNLSKIQYDDQSKAVFKIYRLVPLLHIKI